MAYTAFRIHIFVAFLITCATAGGYTSITNRYCRQHENVLYCDHTFPEQELLLFTEKQDFDTIAVSNFPRLTIGTTDCKNITINNSSIDFNNNNGKAPSCEVKRLGLHDSLANRVSEEVSHLVSYNSYIQTLEDNHLKFALLHNSTVGFVRDLVLHSANVTFVNSTVGLRGKFSIEKLSSVKFVNSKVVLDEGDYFDVHGELTLQNTSIDIKFIHLNPSAKFILTSPTGSWYHDKIKEQEVNEGTTTVAYEGILIDPVPNVGKGLISSLWLNLVLVVNIVLLQCIVK